MIVHFAAFVVLAIVVIITPGPDTVLTIRNTLVGGRRGGIFTGFGVVAGQSVWTIATSAGLAALLLASRPAFDAVRLAGAGYLIFLGARSMLHALRSRGAGPVIATLPSESVSAGGAFRQGMLSNIGNPKMAIFYTSLLPQFVATGHASFVPFLTLGLILSVMTLIWLVVYSFAIEKAGDFLRRPSVGRTIEAISGALLTTFGFRLAADSK